MIATTTAPQICIVASEYHTTILRRGRTREHYFVRQASWFRLLRVIGQHQGRTVSAGASMVCASWPEKGGDTKRVTT